MKKMLIPMVWLFLGTACGGNGNQETPKETVADITKHPDYQKGLALIGKSDCLTCHKVNEASTGPSYQDVAARYPDAADTTIDRIAKHIIKGGSGQWGNIPMTAHPTLSEEDARQMVKYVLLLKK